MPRTKTEAKVIPDKVITESPSHAIRLKCLECGGDQRGEVRKCGNQECTLWPFRFGKTPFSKRGKNTSPAFKKQLSKRMKAMHAKKKKEVKKNETKEQ